MKKTVKPDSLVRRVRARSDLQWCYDRLSHLLYSWQNPNTVPGGFGPKETMTMLADDLPKIRAYHKLSDCYERGPVPIREVIKEDHRSPKGGWADGGYTCRCIQCSQLFGGDKRAVVCADCAYPLATEREDARLG